MNLRIGRQAQSSDARAKWCAGVASELLGDLTRARAYWEAAAAEEWHQPDKEPTVYRALSLAKLGRSEEADALFSQAIELTQQRADLAPEKACANFSLGLALKAAGRQQEAEAALRRALELNPRLRRAARLLTARVIL
jgi:tetratricopeptide (TPR) repeat protein